MTTTPTGPLAGLRILDLTRILAGPTATQLLGDLGADVIKVERPGAGDDTRKWGPPYLTLDDGSQSHESAYYLCANRNKRSVTVDLAHADGQALIKRMLAHCDVLVENYKVGGLAKYGLSYADLKGDFPGLVYCSITGFGQTGPYAPRAGYDFLAQGMGGIMSLTGEPDGEPVKVGVGISDVMCGMYACTAVLSALRHKDKTGEGQYIDLALLDAQVAWLVNEGTNYFMSGEIPKRRGNAHPNIVPYQVFHADDGYIILAVGNDAQFRRFCAAAGAPELADDPRFVTNRDRIHHRDALVPLVADLIVKQSQAYWIECLEREGVPCGPVNNLEQAFDDPQIRHRGMKVSVPYPGSADGAVDLIGNPIKMSATPVSYRRPPPRAGQHTAEVLDELLHLGADEMAALRDKGVI